jgi:hypothetical protein
MHRMRGMCRPVALCRHTGSTPQPRKAWPRCSNSHSSWPDLGTGAASITTGDSAGDQRGARTPVDAACFQVGNPEQEQSVSPTSVPRDHGMRKGLVVCTVNRTERFSSSYGLCPEIRALRRGSAGHRKAHASVCRDVGGILYRMPRDRQARHNSPWRTPAGRAGSVPPGGACPRAAGQALTRSSSSSGTRRWS